MGITPHNTNHISPGSALAIATTGRHDSTMRRMHLDELYIQEQLVPRLLGEQFPEWAHLPLSRIEPSGTVNAIFRLGDELSVRLPRRNGSTRPGGKELNWLPVLARRGGRPSGRRLCKAGSRVVGRAHGRPAYSRRLKRQAHSLCARRPSGLAPARWLDCRAGEGWARRGWVGACQLEGDGWVARIRIVGSIGKTRKVIGCFGRRHALTQAKAPTHVHRLRTDEGFVQSRDLYEGGPPVKGGSCSWWFWRERGLISL